MSDHDFSMPAHEDPLGTIERCGRYVREVIDASTLSGSRIDVWIGDMLEAARELDRENHRLIGALEDADVDGSLEAAAAGLREIAAADWADGKCALIARRTLVEIGAE